MGLPAVTQTIPDHPAGLAAAALRPRRAGSADRLGVQVEVLAARALMSARTFARRFKAATGTTPHRWLLDQRLLLAEHLLEDTDLSIDQIARRCGLGSPDTLRHHFAARRQVSPIGYRRTFRTNADATR